jgi:hypothetical protein
MKSVSPWIHWESLWVVIAPGVFSLNCGVIQGGAGLFAAVAIAARNRDGIASSPGGDEIRWKKRLNGFQAVSGRRRSSGMSESQENVWWSEYKICSLQFL